MLAHEITHVTERHSYLLNRNVRKKVLSLNIMSAAAGAGRYFPAGVLFGASMGGAVSVSGVIAVATIFGYSREMEDQADHLGYQRLIQAGYDGSSMVRALELLDEKLQYEPVEPFWRTHPKLEERIESTKKLVASHNAAKPRQVSDRDYLTAMTGPIRFTITEDLVCRRARTAVARALAPRGRRSGQCYGPSAAGRRLPHARRQDRSPICRRIIQGWDQG